jgi:D-psicose/D-tagatose/L-ribulose 3-epimerase
MDIGIHVSLWTPEWNSPFLDAIDTAADLGFDCVEIPLMNPRELPLAEIGKRLSRHGLKVYCGTGLNPTTDIGSPIESVRKNGIRHLSACIEVCAGLGCNSLGGVLHSPWGMKGLPAPNYAATAASSLAQAADEAEKYGISLAIECINRYENSFINTVSQGLSLLRKVGRDNVGLHLDTYHMNIEERSLTQAITDAGKMIRRIHLSENNRGYPGNGTLPWSDIILAAKAAAYQGPWIIESYVDSAFPASSDVSVWRNIEPDMLSSLGRSLDFLRRMIG